MLRHPQRISVAFYCIRGKAGCYFLAFYHPSTTVSHPLFWESSQYTWNCTGVKTTRKPSAFTTFTTWSCCRKGKTKCIGALLTRLLVYVWELLQWEYFQTASCLKFQRLLVLLLVFLKCFFPNVLAGKSEQRNGSTEKWSLMHSDTARGRRGSNCMDKLQMPARTQSSQWKRVSNGAKSKENAGLSFRIIECQLIYNKPQS